MRVCLLVLRGCSGACGLIAIVVGGLSAEAKRAVLVRRAIFKVVKLVERYLQILQACAAFFFRTLSKME